MRRKFPTWLPAVVIFAGGAVAMQAAHVGVFAERSPALHQSARGTVDTGASGGSTTSTTFGLERRSFAAGDCVTWNQKLGAGEVRATHVVACDQPHLLEVTGRADMPVVAHYPTDAEWTDILDKGDCGRQAATYLSGGLDPYGKYGVGGIEPSAEGWAGGDREVWCGLDAKRHDAHFDPDTLEAFTGGARSQPQGFVYPAGTCLAGDAVADTTSGRVPCAEPHLYEVVGDIDTSHAFSSPPATDAPAWATKLYPACSALTRTAFGGRMPTGIQVRLTSIDPASWGTGQRQVECQIARFGAGGHPTTLTAPLLQAR
jgi:hypothetical protein